MRRKFPGWSQCNNFGVHGAGRILILWNSSTVDVAIFEVLPQVIHISLTCKVTSSTFLLSFIYGYHTIVNRRSLWDNLVYFASSHPGTFGGILILYYMRMKELMAPR